MTDVIKKYNNRRRIKLINDVEVLIVSSASAMPIRRLRRLYTRETAGSLLQQTAIASRPDLDERPSVARQTVVGDESVDERLRIVAHGVVARRVDAGAAAALVPLNAAAHLRRRGGGRRRAEGLEKILVDARASVVDVLRKPDAVAEEVFGVREADPLADAGANRLQQRLLMVSMLAVVVEHPAASAPGRQRKPRGLGAVNSVGRPSDAAQQSTQRRVVGAERKSVVGGFSPICRHRRFVGVFGCFRSGRYVIAD
jgi:hypothetical protein